jgi:hypothetical protein
LENPKDQRNTGNVVCSYQSREREKYKDGCQEASYGESDVVHRLLLEREPSYSPHQLQLSSKRIDGIDGLSRNSAPVLFLFFGKNFDSNAKTLCDLNNRSGAQNARVVHTLVTVIELHDERTIAYEKSVEFLRSDQMIFGFKDIQKKPTQKSYKKVLKWVPRINRLNSAGWSGTGRHSWIISRASCGRPTSEKRCEEVIEE